MRQPYKDGKFYIDGEVNNKDDAAYYLANGKYNNLSDVDSGSSVEAYGSKYLDIQDGDYFVDLDNGSVTDDSIKDNAKDDTASALRKNVKKDTDGRYTVADSQTIKTLTGKELAGNKFGDLWYGVTYTSLNNTNNLTAGQLNVYTDSKGNYIDADYNLGSIKVTTNNGSTEKSVTVSNTNDKYDGAGATNAVSTSVTNQTVIGQDSNYIYRTATITVAATNGATVSKINGVAIAGKTVFDSTTISGSVSFNVIQKISKAQASDNIKGAKYAKSVTTYVISKDNGDAIDANHALLSKYTVSNGKLINYTVGASSVQTETISLSSKNGYYYTDINDQASEKAEVVSGKVAVDTDVNGNIWRLSGGYIYQWNNAKDWSKVYKVDGSFNKMSVYDDNNIVAWNQNDEIYSVIGGQTQTQTPAPVNTTPVVNKGWVKTNTGWTFYNATGAQVKGQWVNDGGVWYMIKADGIMTTGWYNDNGTWYFLQSSGAMKTGWLNDNGTWYYLNASGAMLANTIVDGYKLGASGAWIKQRTQIYDLV